MSPTEIPITVEPHVVVKDDQGVASWRPVLTALSVHGVASNHNVRHVVVWEDGIERYRFRLDADQAQHLARLLTGKISPHLDRKGAQE